MPVACQLHGHSKPEFRLTNKCLSQSFGSGFSRPLRDVIYTQLFRVRTLTHLFLRKHTTNDWKLHPFKLRNNNNKKTLLFTLKFHMTDKYSSGSKNVLGLYIILTSIILVQKANEQTYKQTTKQGS